MSKPTFWDFLTRSTDELVAVGVVRSRVVAERFAATGHLRPISWPWIKTFGCWGGVEPVDVIADRAGVEIPRVRDYAKGRGLKHAHLVRRRRGGRAAAHSTARCSGRTCEARRRAPSVSARDRDVAVGIDAMGRASPPPSAHATPRGRAWYMRDEVEAQLARLHDRKKPRSRRTTGDSSLTSAQPRARRAASGGSTFQGIEHARKVAQIEQSLRASFESAQHRKRGRKRGER